ncbi:TPA: hypothetical protein N0F65_007507 [Lagenidium giganteum]|uniref:Uncharacterized protein n=1 Tax=Lagenidium giganteum TaxID=4803 RepID=A0AAV2ZSC2_9STRA|nr:TPA: hypothetical protein N0F65_007507 [Lagenidium giganteum]
MGNQSVFHGALGWDDWIWWAGIGGIGLFVLMMLLCCCVCVQRAKRKGREEALAAVQARQREQQQQQQAQLRYAQAQQARYPSQDTFKFSKSNSPLPVRDSERKRGPVVSQNAHALPPAQNKPFPSLQSYRNNQQDVVHHMGAAPTPMTRANPQGAFNPTSPCAHPVASAYPVAYPPTDEDYHAPFVAVESPMKPENLGMEGKGSVTLQSRIDALRNGGSQQPVGGGHTAKPYHDDGFESARSLDTFSIGMASDLSEDDRALAYGTTPGDSQARRLNQSGVSTSSRDSVEF